MGTQPRKGFARVEPVAQSHDPATVPSEPTLEQCENLAAAMGFPLLPEALRPPYYAESLRNLHALTVKALNGDEDAARTLSALKAAFARRPEHPKTNT